MQVVSPSSPTPKFFGKERFAEVYGKLSEDFGSKLHLGFTEEEKVKNLEKPWWDPKELKTKVDGDKETEESEGEGEEFSFASINAENSPVTVEEAYEDGQIQPVYPLFDRSLLFDYERDDPKEKAEFLRSPLKKLFVESEESAAASTAEESEPMGPFCSWSGRTVEEASPESCRKSNSTGFSKLWRFRDLVLRSNSDGKDAFVFLSNGDGGDKSQLSSKTAAKKSVVKRTEKEKTNTERKMKTKSAHERLYMRNRAIREEGKRRSYLPYKHVGFFTNVNGLTRNVHPY